MYTQFNLRDNLKEWRNRLYNVPHTQLNRQLDSFISKLENEPLINANLLELLNKADLLQDHPMDRCRNALWGNLLFSLFENKRFEDDSERAMYHYCFLKVLQEQNAEIYRSHVITSHINLNSEISKIFVENYIDPLVHYLSDQVDEGSVILYLLEKYKKKCEWFESDRLRYLYESLESEGVQEKVLDRDLRKFLFEQGIDYPFSTPSSASGQADVVGLLHTDDPLVLEVKIFDRQKNYRKQRIVDGFRQIVSYANDYHKPVGYLLVFNMDNVEINIDTTTNNSPTYNRVFFSGKVYFIIFISIPPRNTDTASKRGKIEKLTIPEEELTSEVTT